VFNEGLHDVYSSPNMIRVIKSVRMGWVGHEACVGATSNAYTALVVRPEMKNSLEILAIHQSITLKSMFE
jgi:hypothetical protein